MAVATSAMLRHLAGKIVGHRIDLVGQILPDAADILHIGLAAELAFRASSRATRVTSAAKAFN